MKKISLFEIIISSVTIEKGWRNKQMQCSFHENDWPTRENKSTDILVSFYVSIYSRKWETFISDESNKN